MADYPIVGSGTGAFIRLQTDTVEPTVATPPGPPVAAFGYTADNLTVYFDASDSYDPDTSIDEYEWDFGDGSPPFISASPTAEHTYSAYGSYTVNLTVTDTDTNSDNTSATVTVSNTTLPPSASFTYTIDGLDVDFNASVSTDPDSGIDEYGWDFGDGSTDFTSSSATASHTYEDYGTYTVTLTVTDTDSNTDSTTRTFTLEVPEGGSAYDQYAAKAEEIAGLNDAAFIHMGEVVQALAAANGEDGWPDYIVDWIHASALGHELIASYVADQLRISSNPSTSGWQFSGTIDVDDLMEDVVLHVDLLTGLGINIFMDIYDGSTLVSAFSIDRRGQSISIGDLGVAGSSKTYSYNVRGTPTEKGQGTLRLSMSSPSTPVRPSVYGSLLILEV